MTAPDDPTIREVGAPQPVPSPAALRAAVSVLCHALTACRERLSADGRWSPDYVAAAVPLLAQREELFPRELAQLLAILHPDH
jgi:hypothetical protein